MSCALASRYTPRIETETDGRVTFAGDHWCSTQLNSMPGCSYVRASSCGLRLRLPLPGGRDIYDAARLQRRALGAGRPDGTMHTNQTPYIIQSVNPVPSHRLHAVQRTGAVTLLSRAEPPPPPPPAYPAAPPPLAGTHGPRAKVQAGRGVQLLRACSSIACRYVQFIYISDLEAGRRS